MKTKLADIARAADVSISTVSLALNGQPGVSREIAERVVQVAQEMEYELPRKKDRPSVPTLQFIKIIKNGEILNNDHKPFVADYIDGVVEASNGAGYKVEVLSIQGEDIGALCDQSRIATAAGAIVLATELDESDIARFEGFAKPLVFIDSNYDHTKADFVDMNNDEAVYMAVAHFVARGHTEIGLVQGKYVTPNFFAREVAFRAAALQYKLTYVEADDRFCVGTRYQSAYADMAKLLKSRTAKLPSALFCVNDTIALGCMRAFTESGMVLPRDVSLIGFDNLSAGEMSTPPLTTIEVSKQRIAHRAVTILLDRISSGIDHPTEKIKVGGRLIVRESVDQKQG